MILKLKQFFEQHLLDTTDSGLQTDEHKAQLASAALMLELVHADHKTSKAETVELKRILQAHFDLDPSEADDLLELAAEERHEATDYYQFTRLINEHYSQQQKRKLVYRLWQIAMADDHLHKLEEHLVRKLASLLHVPHAAFMQSKHKARR